MNQTSNQVIEKLQDEYAFFKIYTLYAIFDVAFKDENMARQVEDENGTHKDKVRPVYIILNEKEYEAEADSFPIENYQARSNYNYNAIKEVYLCDYARICDCCNNVLEEGFYIEAFKDEWFCSEKCLHSKYTEEAYLQMYEDDTAYWTTI